MTPKEWIGCLRVLRAAYPTSLKLDDDAIDVWFTLLEDLPGDRVLAAIVHMTKTTRAFPSVAEIREHAEGGSSKPDHGAAWGELLEQIRRVGQYPVYRLGQRIEPVPQFRDPLLEEVVKRLGGWVHICQTMTTDDQTTWFAQFRNVYNETHARARRDGTFAGLGLNPASSEQSKLLGDGGAK